jgi:hypothetical protein
MVEAERFITLILREPFYYTTWREHLFEGVSLDEFYANVKQFRAARKET